MRKGYTISELVDIDKDKNRYEERINKFYNSIKRQERKNVSLEEVKTEERKISISEQVIVGAYYKKYGLKFLY